MSVSCGRKPAFAWLLDWNHRLSVPELVIASVTDPAPRASSAGAWSEVVNTVLGVVPAAIVPIEPAGTAGRLTQFSVDSVQVSDANAIRCVSAEPANESAVVRSRNDAPVSVVPAGASGSSKRR